MSSEKLSENTIVQEYVICNVEKRFLLLNALLRKIVNKKVLVLCSSAAIIKFLSEVLGHFKISVATADESMPQKDRAETFKTFSEAKESILLCTDKCASSSISDFNLDWFVQYDPPTNFEEYVTTLKSLGKSTHTLLFLQSFELAFLTQLKKKNISFSEFEVKWSKVSNVQNEVLKLTSKVYSVYLAASNGYRAYVKFYANHPLKKIFDFSTLDLVNVALSFGLKTALHVETEAKKDKKSAKRSIEDEEEVPKKKPKVRTVRVLETVRRRSKKAK